MCLKVVRNLFLTLLTLVVGAIPVFAAVNLSVNPLAGGSSLRFGRLDESFSSELEVRIRVSTNDGEQYQVFQRIVDQIANERGETIPNGAILAYTLSGSNSSGTLYAQGPEFLSVSDQLIYTSAPDGSGDSFTVVYSINPQRISSQGNFAGKIQYLVRPIGQGSSQDAVLDVFVDVTGTLKADVRGKRSFDRVVLNSQPAAANQDAVEISFEGNLGNDIKVYQEVLEMPRSESGEDISEDAIKFLVTDNRSGQSSFTSPTRLDSRRNLVYSSNAGEDEFQVNFVFDAQASNQGSSSSGNYRGKIRYIVESGMEAREFDVILEIGIEPTFTLDVELPPGGVKFDRLLPTSEPQLNEVKVRVRSNLGKPYMVMQKIVSPLTNEEGKEIKEGFFTQKVENLGESTGQPVADQFANAREGEAAIYKSDAEGSPAEFRVIYKLEAYPQLEAGNYATSIVYSLGEI